ncbi:conserved hypothetical protein [Pseudomonas veronii]|uniref:DUF6904 family protein n=1 Tax=Pseudomonas veronii TaxID=76761 RepID=UPI00177666E1|nr:hypothetical protein [Pseudomonas veronii]CAD0264234.1 conserved hypothetical protein [Pseudomonas veronii]
MFTYDLLKNHAGIVLCGDYSSLQSLYEVVHVVNEKSMLLEDKESWFLGLAFDVRKAYERQRQVFQPPAHFPEKGTRYGVEILWPVILLQCSMLRASLQTFDNTKLEQAMTYALEHIVLAALDDDFGVQAKAIIESWQRIDCRHPHPGQKLISRGAVFCSWSKKQRREGLAGLLASLDPMYPTLFPIWERNGAKHLIAPDILDSYEDADWVDPKW